MSLVTAIACGGSSEPGPEYPKAPPKEAEPAVVQDMRPPAGSLWRDELIATLNSGLGSFLQHVEVEPSLEEGRFRGFRVMHLSPPGYWDGIDLEVGDVVVSVNDLPIERETQAYAAWESLRSASQIRVKLLRAGVPHESVIQIVARDGAPLPAAAGAGGASAGVSGAPAMGGMPAIPAAGASAGGASVNAGGASSNAR